jgi:hypothetical protein
MARIIREVLVILKAFCQLTEKHFIDKNLFKIAADNSQRKTQFVVSLAVI